MVRMNAIRAIAILEAAKGAVVLLAGAGILSLVHSDVHDLAARLVAHAHLNPASRFPRIFIEAVSQLQDSRLTLLAVGAGAYALVRFVEAYGLYFERAWAEVLAAVSGAIYVPFEVVELLHEATWLGVAVLSLNLGIVAIMVRALLRRRGNVATNAR